MNGRVLLLARKPLLHNSRIFKQVESLQAAGYEVTAVGLLTAGTAAREYTSRGWVHRVPMSPPHARLFGGRPGAPPNGGVGDDGRLRRFLRGAGASALFPLRSLDWNRRVERLAATLGPFEIVHVNDLDALAVGTRIARRLGARLVYDAQELYPELHGFPWSYRVGLNLRERQLLQDVDVFLTVNDAIADELARRHGRRPDAVIRNHARWLDEPQSGTVGLRGLLDVPADTPLLVVSGGLLPGRGLEQTVLALEHLDPDSVLCFLGDGPVRDELRGLAERVGAGGRVRFVDYVEHSEVASTIATADVGIVPYRPVSENHRLATPSRLFHYLMAGLPVAASRLPVVAAILGTGGELFDPDDPRSIAAAVSKILADPARYREQVELLRPGLAWESEEQELLRVYGSLGPVSRPSAPDRADPA